MSEPGKPGINPQIAALTPPPIPAVRAWAARYDGAYGPLIDMAQAVPGYPPHPDLLRWLGEAAGAAEFAGYGPIEGDMALRRAFAKECSEAYAAQIDPACVHATAGGNQAFVVAAMTVARPGERIVLTSPCYFNHETSLEMLGIGVRHVECLAEAGFVPDPAAIEAAIGDDVRAVALVSPNNPTGAVYPPEVLAAIRDICRARGVWLILDETYRDFLPHGAARPHDLFSAADWGDHLIQLYSFSKSFCIPGHRLGTIIAGRPVVAALAKIMDNLQICAPRPPQVAVARALPVLGAWKEGNRGRIAGRADALRAVLRALPGWHVESIGAYFAFIRHPFAELGSTRAAERLATDLGILTLPGAFFGKGLDRFLRLAFANVGVDTIGTLGDRLKKL